MPAMNATGTGFTALSTFGNWTGTLLVVVTAIFIIGLLLLIFNSYERYRKLRGIFHFLGVTAGYFWKGLIGVAVFGSLFLGLWYLGLLQDRGEIDLLVVGFWAGIAIGGFFAISGLGYVLDKIWKNLLKKEKKFKKEAEA